jgi:hypothetical protein
MSAAINFLSGNSIIQSLSGSGLAFFGSAGFGASVKVGNWNQRTFISDGNGINQGPECWNNQYLNIGSGIIGQVGSGVALTAIPNAQATLNINFTNPTPVHTQNGVVQIYDRVNTNNLPSGVTCMLANIIHPDPSQSNDGSGSTTWQNVGGSGSVLALPPSPGPSGLYAGNGSNGNWQATEHDWYVLVSASPNSIGAKQFGLYAYVEFL